MRPRHHAHRDNGSINLYNPPPRVRIRHPTLRSPRCSFSSLARRSPWQVCALPRIRHSDNGAVNTTRSGHQCPPLDQLDPSSNTPRPRTLLYSTFDVPPKAPSTSREMTCMTLPCSWSTPTSPTTLVKPVSHVFLAHTITDPSQIREA